MYPFQKVFDHIGGILMAENLTITSEYRGGLYAAGASDQEGIFSHAQIGHLGFTTKVGPAAGDIFSTMVHAMVGTIAMDASPNVREHACIITTRRCHMQITVNETNSFALNGTVVMVQIFRPGESHIGYFPFDNEGKLSREGRLMPGTDCEIREVYIPAPRTGDMVSKPGG